MPFDINRCVRILLAEGNEALVYRKAIELYRLQAWIYAPNQWRVLKSTKLLTVVKLLEHLQATEAKKLGLVRIPLQELAHHPVYTEIFNDYVSGPNGWTHLTELHSARSIESYLQKTISGTERKKIEDYRVISSFIGFSLQYNPDHHPGGSNGGIRMAQWGVTETKLYKINLGKTAIHKIWKRYQLSAPFLYLMHYQKIGYPRLRITNRHFARRLLNQAQNIDPTLQLLGAYNSIVSTLRERGYSYESLNLPYQTESPKLWFKPFPAEDLEVIQTYIPRER